MLPRIVLLPGLDGTGLLLKHLAGLLHSFPRTDVLSYPSRGPQDIGTLAAHVETQLDDNPAPFVIVAESFGGPIALRVAAASPVGLSALVLVNSFALTPLSKPFALAARFGLPALTMTSSRLLTHSALLTRTLLDEACPAELVDQVRLAIRRVPLTTLRARLRVALSTNELGSYLRTQLPLFYMRSLQDHVIGPGALETLIRLRPGLQLRELSGPHLLSQRHPQAVATVLQEWFQDDRR